MDITLDFIKKVFYTNSSPLSIVAGGPFIGKNFYYHMHIPFRNVCGNFLKRNPNIPSHNAQSKVPAIENYPKPLVRHGHETHNLEYPRSIETHINIPPSFPLQSLGTCFCTCSWSNIKDLSHIYIGEYFTQVKDMLPKNLPNTRLNKIRE